MSLRLTAVAAIALLAAGIACSDSTGPAPVAPDAPAITAITPGNAQLSIAFTPPAEDGGADVERYEYSLDDGATFLTPTPVDTLSPIVVTGLTNGSTYQVRLRAVNRAGTSASSAAVAGTPRTVPGTPTISGVTAGNQQLSVAFGPIADGGAALSNIEYRLSAGGAWTARSPASTASPLVITGLTNGTAYDVSIRGVNVAGAGAAAVAVSGTPRTLPGAPTLTSMTVGSQFLSVAFDPIADGGSPLTNIEYQLNGGAWTPRSPADLSTPVVVFGLTNGTQYTVRIRGLNAVGAGPESNALVGTPRTVPNPPTVNTVTGGYRTASVAFTPGFNGGATITGYQYELNNSGTWTPVGLPPSPFTVSGLADATGYTLRLRAINSAGTGSPSNSIGFATAPAIPTVTASADSVQVFVCSNTQATASGYRFYESTSVADTGTHIGTTSSGVTCLSRTTPPSGAVLYYRARACNTAGACSTMSAASNSVVTRITQPTIDSVFYANLGADIDVHFSFSGPSSGPGVATNVRYSINGGATWINRSPAGATSPFRIPNPGGTFSLRVAIVNSSGTSVPSNARTVP
jgi:titin